MDPAPLPVNLPQDNVSKVNVASYTSDAESLESTYKENASHILQETKKSLNLPSRLLHLNYDASIHLTEAHVVLCQNIEFFATSMEDIQTFEHITDGGHASEIGQVGLRCIHCGDSPFAKAELAVTFPGSVGLVSECVQKMASVHFPKCSAMPKLLRDRFQTWSCAVVRSGSSLLHAHCLNVCKDMGLCNREPFLSGILVPNIEGEVMSKSPLKSFPKVTSVSDYRRPGRQALRHLEELRNIIPSMEKDNEAGKSKAAHSFYFDQIWPTTHYEDGSPVATKKWATELPTPMYFEDWSSPSPKRAKLDIDSLFQGPVAASLAEWDDADQKIPSFETALAGEELKQSHQEHIVILDREILSHASVQLRNEDKTKLGEFLFYAFKQFKPYAFTTTELETRRIRGRDLNELMCVGLQCIHCMGKKFLWLSLDTFRTSNSMARLSTHAMNCASSPKMIRNALQELHDMPRCPPQKGGRATVLSWLWESLVVKAEGYVDRQVPGQSESSIIHNESTTLIPSVIIESDLNRQNVNPVLNSVPSLVCPEDRDLLTPFVFRTMHYLERCVFLTVENNRRLDIPRGFSGLKCTFCEKRCFYWTSPDRFTNSFSDVTKHVRTCRKCPTEVRDELNELYKTHHSDMRKAPRGLQTVFFRRLWTRLHSTDISEPEVETASGALRYTPL